MNKPAKPKPFGEISVDLVQFLVVDDYAFVRRIVGEALKACGVLKFHSAQDGMEAISFLRLRSPTNMDSTLDEMMGHRPDIAQDLAPDGMDFSSAHSYCVITDFNMPYANGLQLLKAIRCGETNVPRDTPVILLTGYSEDFVIAAALELDVSAFIVKPVSQNTMRDKLKRVLGSKITLKDPSVYAKVRILNEKGEVIADSAEVAVSDGGATHHDNDVRWLPLMAIQPGAVLARDLRTERGALLLQEGAVLSEFVLKKLTDVQHAQGLSGTIPVRNR